ncbi:MAG: hypothetical protein AAF211_17205, partial [Myxococcota bacterium]
MDARRHAPWLLVVLLPALVVALVGLVKGPTGHDSVTQLVWNEGLQDAVARGDLYPRWLPDLNHGFGSLVFGFYPPVAHYLTLLFGPVDGLDPTGWARLAVSIGAAVTVSAVSFGALARAGGLSQPAASLGALAYVLLPYHFSYVTVTRAALAETWAMAWVPALLACLVRLVRNPRSRQDVAGLALFVALLVGTHLPTVILITPVGVAIAASVWWTGRREPSALLAVPAAGGLGITLVAVYLIPALEVRPWTTIETLTQGSYAFSTNFLDAPGHAPGLHAYQRMVALITVVVAASAAMLARHSPARRLGGWGGIALLAFALQFSVSAPLWALPGMAWLSFPSRWGSVLTLAAAVLVARAAETPGNRPLLLGLVLVAGLVSVPAFRATNPDDPRPYLAARMATTNDYVPRWADWDTAHSLEGLAAMDATGARVDQRLRVALAGRDPG